jgi:hypothetical protein
MCEPVYFPVCPRLFLPEKQNGLESLVELSETIAIVRAQALRALGRQGEPTRAEWTARPGPIGVPAEPVRRDGG